MTDRPTTPTHDDLDRLALDPGAPVALALHERLQPVEGDGAVIFPPTYAGIGYDISTLVDGRKVVQIDSVGSQANRIEPIFRTGALAALVPQVTITYGNAKAISLLEAGHRLGDALIRSTDLAGSAREAFEAYNASGDADLIARLAPTSIVFGVWDSRDTQAKLPRILQSVVRGTDVSVLTRSAQYTPALDYAELEVFSDDEKKKSEGKSESPLAQRGFVHVPSVGVPGGVIVHGDITRSTSVNLIALRRLRGGDADRLRRYILGLTLVAATEPVEAFMRQGCLLVPHPDHPATWHAVARDGARAPIALTRELALAYASAAAADFGVGADRVVAFDKNRAKKDVAEAKKK